MRLRTKMKIDKDEVKKAMKNASTKAEFQRLQCVYLAAIYPEKAASEIGKMVGLSQSSIWRIHSEYRKRGISGFAETRGGRHRENLTKEEESKLLEPFLKEALKSGIIEISKIKIAYEEKVGKTVPSSTVYRMIKRHGWRKVIPFKRHTKTNKEEQEEFKKTSQKS